MLRYQFGPFLPISTHPDDELLAVTDYALQRTPNSEEPLLWPGWALYRMGKKLEAVADWQKALEDRQGIRMLNRPSILAAANP